MTQNHEMQTLCRAGLGFGVLFSVLSGDEEAQGGTMTWNALWRKLDEILLWPFATVFLCYVLYGLLVLRQRAENWPFLSVVLLLTIAAYWWAGFKFRLAKFLRGALRDMIIEELQESRIAFVTWLREDAPWRGENPFLEPKVQTDNGEKVTG